MLIQRLVGIACEALAYDMLCEAFRVCDDPDALAVRVLPRLKAADPPLGSLKGAFLLERLIVWDICQRVFVPGDKAGTWKVHKPFVECIARFQEFDDTYTPDASKGGLRVFCVSLGRHAFDSTLREVNIVFDAHETWLDAPQHKAAERLEELEKTIAESSNPIVEVFIPSFSRARELDERCRATRCAVHLIVNLFAHHGRTGKFPDSLDELDAPDLGQLRTDPFSGKDFVYGKKGDSFILYSLATNLKDDGGKHGKKWEEGDFVFWPVQD